MSDFPAASPEVSGVILAGGRSSRMGGADKALQLLGGRPLLDWAIQALSPQVGEVILSANDPAKYASFGLAVACDDLNQAGPLAGIQSAFQAARHDLLATVPCDVPHFPHDLVSRLRSAMDARQADLAFARTADGRQPVFTLLRRSTLPALTAYLASGGRKADGWYAGLRIAEVEFANASAFGNINTIEELRVAQLRLGKPSDRSA